MTSVSLQIAILVLLRVEVSSQVVVVLDEEVGLADSYPKELGVLAEEHVYFLVAVSIDVGEPFITLLLLVDSG